MEQKMSSAAVDTQHIFQVNNLSVYYGGAIALRDVTMDIQKDKITAFIGPSGCGKSTLLRCFNRTNDLISGAQIKGQLTYRGQNFYAAGVDPVVVRRRVGMVFQQPNPFPKTIYDNVAYGLRVNGIKNNMDEIVEKSLRRAALWDEVKDNLQKLGTSLSGGQQQRLCIARAIAVQPDVILMDEPCSALDPVSTMRIEELMVDLKQEYTIVIVTHNMQQASRVADYTAFFNAEAMEGGKRVGYLVEVDSTDQIFSNPQNQSTRDYVSGRFG
ncbi:MULTISPECIES: phosphate ABC transporter ATP-binding protein PstB [unclassified Nodularia (in: cyanobacteria)]|uniref:phosphate ABC transporter ATP-binding protein PstB n=1 Tax=unclassified Nodularia (in: cyanobacteria) TaxID=2656917 RepID=UPI001880F73F|nr:MULTISPECIES: phosphate ABC transporter ATP-binding protein PstB [unclassified Nodularia (in: cyanobacteria)]MBE9200939.1 phosphate ABC transporter ATP-binding protein [Nodularia sp. LEGE 06071]MCC2692475.1 phosphate ABC transporter ATP-binding protein [Nodularia sp. LEGE 04288]